MLDQLKPRDGSRKTPKRVGRGPGSGWHKTSGRGMKGQGHRSAGRETPLAFEGGQMPLVRRLPKRGFFSRHRVSYRIVNLSALAVFDEGASVDVAALEQHGLVKRGKEGVKVLGEGAAPAKLTLKVHKVSAGARKKIEEAGGSVELV